MNQLSESQLRKLYFDYVEYAHALSSSAVIPVKQFYEENKEHYDE